MNNIIGIFLTLLTGFLLREYKEWLFKEEIFKND